MWTQMLFIQTPSYFLFKHPMTTMIDSLDHPMQFTPEFPFPASEIIPACR